MWSVKGGITSLNSMFILFIAPIVTKLLLKIGHYFSSHHTHFYSSISIIIHLKQNKSLDIYIKNTICVYI